MTDALNRLSNQFELVKIHDQTYDDHLFTLQPKWL
jgi:hypothetical protein